MSNARAAATGWLPMARKVPLERLADEVDKILQEYGDDVQVNLNEIVTAMTKKGAQAVRGQAKGAVKGTGKYASAWTSEIERTRLATVGTIYNRKPGLPHLLEHGHALRNGGRTAARPHIEPVETEIVREFESRVKSKL